MTAQRRRNVGGRLHALLLRECDAEHDVVVGESADAHDMQHDEKRGRPDVLEDGEHDEARVLVPVCQFPWDSSER